MSWDRRQREKITQTTAIIVSLAFLTIFIVTVVL